MTPPDIPLIPVQAATIAPKYDLLFFMLVGVSGLVVVGVFATIIFFCSRYRRFSPARRSNIGRFRPLEYTWIGVPLVIFLCFFAWGALLYYKMEEPPDDSIPVYVVAKQWMWKLEHLDGRREINQLHVPLGRDIKLVMTSEDVIHSFFVPAFRIKQDILPGRYMTIWFNATRPGAYQLYCAEYCGTDHSRMRGTIYVLSDADYARWLQAGQVSASMSTQGRQLFQRFGCSGCHGPASTVHAPDLNGVFGSLVHLKSGATKLADEQYIRDSVLLPSKDVVAGYPDKMPSFKGQISEMQLLQILAYIKSLSIQTGGQP